MFNTPYLPASEADRLRAVQPYAQLPAKQAVFQAMVHLTARLFAVPVSLMSLVQADEVQYSGNTGMPGLPERLAREDSICSAAMYRGTMTIFPNLQQQPCPWVSPAARGDFQFYAGHPLLTPEGYAIGMLCVLDQTPRDFSPKEQTILQQLATLAMRLLTVQLTLTDGAAAGDPLAGVQTRLGASIQRIETLLKLTQWATNPVAVAAYQADIYQERQLILADINHTVTRLLVQAKASA